MFGRRKLSASVHQRPSTTKQVKGSTILDPKLALDKPVEFESNSYEEALDKFASKQALDAQQGRGNSPRAGQDTRPIEPSQLSRELIAKLPPDLSVVHLYADFPHVLNRIAATWGNHNAFFELMDELMIDKRGSRVGFPFATALEISRLAEHYEQFISRRPVSRYDVVQTARKPLF